MPCSLFIILGIEKKKLKKLREHYTNKSCSSHLNSQCHSLLQDQFNNQHGNLSQFLKSHQVMFHQSQLKQSINLPNPFKPPIKKFKEPLCKDQVFHIKIQKTILFLQ